MSENSSDVELMRHCLESVCKRFGAVSDQQYIDTLQFIVRQSLRELVRIEDEDKAMCFLWPIMKKLNSQLIGE
ncbi:hypothetical protein ACU6U9_02600 [Pseudomonas sp. HK3]|jgi:hypothetical protein